MSSLRSVSNRFIIAGAATTFTVVSALFALQFWPSASVARSGASSPTASAAAAPTVYTFPIAGGRVATPGTGITFRGVPASSLGSIVVTGSKTGVHAGTVKADSDGNGGSFIPTTAFRAGETVTVATSLNIAGGQSGSFSFKVATPAGRIRGGSLTPPPRVRGDVWRFASDGGLVPASVRITKQPTRGAAQGDVFIAPQVGPVQNGPMILGPYGGLIWFKPLPKGQSASDFRVQTYNGQPALTWWQGTVTAAGVGMGVDQIYDKSYRPIASVRAGNGLMADLHEFQLTGHNTALITSYFPVIWNATSVRHGSKHEIVFDSVAQEIDIPTGLVLWQWDSLDHVPLTDSYQPAPTTAGHPYDYFHINSIQEAADGSIVVSSRDLWAVFDLSAQNGATIWTVGGKHSSFKMGARTRFAFQHDARLTASGVLTLFDDGAGPPAVEHQSRALALRLDTTHKTATLIRRDFHSPAELAFYEGGVQPLSNGDTFVGWGQQPYFTEFNARGQTVFDGRFVGANSSYRAYRFAWSATPANQVGVGTRVSGGRTTVYASWNGATDVASWRILGGSSATSLQTVASGRRRAFETAFRLPHAEQFVATQALDAHGNVLGTSTAIKVK